MASLSLSLSLFIPSAELACLSRDLPTRAAACDVPAELLPGLRKRIWITRVDGWIMHLGCTGWMRPGGASTGSARALPFRVAKINNESLYSLFLSLSLWLFSATTELRPIDHRSHVNLMWRGDFMRTTLA